VGDVLGMPPHDLFGLEVPSTAPLFLMFVGVHIAVGLTCVITGAIAALSRKGRGRHSTFGDVYFAGICGLFATATGLAIMRWREDYGLFLIGLAAFGLALAGFLARRRHWPGDAAHIIGMGGSYVAMLTAFYVDNGKHLPLWDRLPTFAFWLLPSLVGVPLIVRALRKYAASPSWLAGR
jgi:hypothetical protein